jgi:simple sugar transport system ATP-binding protein
VLALKAEGVSILFVSHKLDEVYRVCDSVTIMRNGTSVFSCNPGERIPTKEETIEYMTGHKVNTDCMSLDSENNPVVMDVSGYSLDGAFEDISFKLHKGEVIGITGLLGCGRSELAESLFGVLPANGGSVTIKDKNLSIIGSIDQAMSAGISYVPDDRLTKGLCLRQSIYNNSLSCTVDDLSNKRGVIDYKAVKEFYKEAFSAISIPKFKGTNPVSSLSGGNQQKVVLIKWLATDPSILILNCPTVGVDVGAKSEILSLVADLAKTKGVGVIVISDDSYELLQICSRILIMKDGRISDEISSKNLSVDRLEEMINAEKGAAV